MAVTHENPPRLAANGSLSAMCLEDKFELLKEIGDGSFGSVALARVRTAGAHIARRGTMVGVTSSHADRRDSQFTRSLSRR